MCVLGSVQGGHVCLTLKPHYRIYMSSKLGYYLCWWCPPCC